MEYDRFKVKVNYKSGHFMVIDCEHFKVTQNAGGGMTVEWTDAKPRPLMMGVDHIESVWQL